MFLEIMHMYMYSKVTCTLSIIDCISDFLLVVPYNWVDQVSGDILSPASMAILII